MKKNGIRIECMKMSYTNIEQTQRKSIQIVQTVAYGLLSAQHFLLFICHYLYLFVDGGKLTDSITNSFAARNPNCVFVNILKEFR